MAIETVYTCPLGSTCEEVKDGKVHRCAWYVEMEGQDSQGETHKESKCAIAWSPILQTEIAGTNRGQTAAIESMRNETIKRQEQALKALQEKESEDGTKAIVSEQHRS